MTELLMTPGPTIVPPEVLEAMAKPVIHHRTPEFLDLFAKTTERMKKVFKTQNDLFTIAGSGTSAMDAAICNTIKPGDKVLCITSGVFSDRLMSIAKAYGANITQVNFEWGAAVDPEAVRKALTPDTKLVTMVFNETSTGVKNDVKAVSDILKGTKTMLLVDAISALGGDIFETDKWNVDLCVAGSQKCLAMATGLAFISVSPRAWDVMQTNPTPRFYLDLRKYKGESAKPTPFSTPVTYFYGLEASLNLLEKEGLEKRIKRHAEVAKLCRDGVKKLGFELFPKVESTCSNTLTSVKFDKAKELTKKLVEKHQIRIAGGQKQLEGKIFRIGHMGVVQKEHVQRTLAALEDVKKGL